MNASGFSDVQEVDAELEKKSWWCFGMGPKAPVREGVQQVSRQQEVTGVYGRTVVSNEKWFPILKERSRSDFYTRELLFNRGLQMCSDERDNGIIGNICSICPGNTS